MTDFPGAAKFQCADDRRRKREVVGLEAIGAIFGRTRWTIRRWIEREGFPASQLPDGTWTTTQSQIEQWLRDRMAKH